MTPEEFSAWRKANKLKSQWYIAVDGQVRPDVVTLGEAEALREQFGSIPIHLMHVTQSPDGDWIHLDHPEDSSLSFEAAWRKHPATERQRDLLRFFGQRTTRNTTKGEASEMIDRLFLDPKNEERWEKEKERREDAEYEAMMEAEDDKPARRSRKKPAKKKKSSGCGCLFLILIILFIITVLSETSP